MSEIDQDSVPVLEDETATPRPEEDVADVARAEPDVTPHPGDAATADGD